MQLTLQGEPADLAAFCQAVGRQTEEPVTLYQTPKTVLDYIEAAKTNTSIPPIRKPPKERTAMLEAIFADYLAAGMDAKTIKEHLLSEHDISMTGHQVCGWLGRMRQKAKRDEAYHQAIGKAASLVDPTFVYKASDRPKDAPKTNLEGNCSSETKDAVKEPLKRLDELTQRPCNLSEPDLTIWKMHVAGNMDIDIKQKLERMGHPMRVSEIRKRIDQMKAEMA